MKARVFSPLIKKKKKVFYHDCFSAFATDLYVLQQY